MRRSKLAMGVAGVMVAGALVLGLPYGAAQAEPSATIVQVVPLPSVASDPWTQGGIPFELRVDGLSPERINAGDFAWNVTMRHLEGEYSATVIRWDVVPNARFLGTTMIASLWPVAINGMSIVDVRVSGKDEGGRTKVLASLEIPIEVRGANAGYKADRAPVGATLVTDRLTLPVESTVASFGIKLSTTPSGSQTSIGYFLSTPFGGTRNVGGGGDPWFDVSVNWMDGQPVEITPAADADWPSLFDYLRNEPFIVPLSFAASSVLSLYPAKLSLTCPRPRKDTFTCTAKLTNAGAEKRLTVSPNDYPINVQARTSNASGRYGPWTTVSQGIASLNQAPTQVSMRWPGWRKRGCTIQLRATVSGLPQSASTLSSGAVLRAQ